MIGVYSPVGGQGYMGTLRQLLIRTSTVHEDFGSLLGFSTETIPSSSNMALRQTFPLPKNKYNERSIALINRFLHRSLVVHQSSSIYKSINFSFAPSHSHRKIASSSYKVA